MLEEAALAAALLSERDPFLRSRAATGRARGPRVTSRSDVLDRVHALEQFERQGVADERVGTLNPSAAKHIFRTRDQLVRLAARLAQSRPAGSEARSRSRRTPSSAPFSPPIPIASPAAASPAVAAGSWSAAAACDWPTKSALADEELYVCVDVDAAQRRSPRPAGLGRRSHWLPDRSHRHDHDRRVRRSQRQSRRPASGQSFDDLVLEESPAALPEPKRSRQRLSRRSGDATSSMALPAD